MSFDPKFKTDGINDVPDSFFEITIDRDDDLSLSEESLKAIMRKMLAVSSLIHHNSRRGGADQIIFNGRLAKFIHDNILETQVFRSVEFTVNDTTVDEYDNIELIRKGDYFKLIYENVPDDITGMGQIRLEKTKRKQPDLIYKIKIKE